METPEEIQSQIDALKVKLRQSKEHYRYKLLTFNGIGEDEVIGCFAIGRLKVLLRHLNMGHVLRYKSYLYGRDFTVYMNGFRNRIIVNDGDDKELEKACFLNPDGSTYTPYISKINEDTILNYMLRTPGEWYLDTQRLINLS
jgi:restriction endonuclease S subunit